MKNAMILFVTSILAIAMTSSLALSSGGGDMDSSQEDIQETSTADSDMKFHDEMEEKSDNEAEASEEAPAQ